MVFPLCQPADVLAAWPGFGQLPALRQTSLINTASQNIKNFCRRGFDQTVETEYHDGKNNSVIWLRKTPVISVTSITINNNLTGINSVLTNADGTDWTLSPHSGRLVRGPGLGDSRLAWWFPSGTRNIVVIYFAGFSTVPPTITEGAVQYIRYLSERATISGIYASERIGDYNYALNVGANKQILPDHIIDLVAEYVLNDGPM